ncbi:MAG: SBBP repeat-containing protein [Limnospira sp. PMC 1291.21]|nr:MULTISPECIES: SBBP repeat-containing protein [unclassified Limnospira]MDT9177010.1 SBBP repeat-containing protein [Limnospira sp. PMC 1238.20]MDT9192188.1 SBBP repeat-containing protein [Limnospira sp. PMC 1245.20]MDT9202560.1 SBBP repeat-containing protein [Limnospira sp. PMC 1243.20]MDT9207715.1 SBBP repeat-containing protein [Limnospira sp. PMC 1252.20]MDT9212331.1 SBBP repeat-containing protein [Limnospira sp. PMC 1256.20]
MNNTSEIFHIFESSDSQNFMPSQGFSGVEGEPVAVQMSAPPEFAWTRLLGSGEEDSATALTTGSDGSIYVAGYTYGDLDGQTNSGRADAFISRFQPDGTQDWTRLLGSGDSRYAHALTTGSDGSIYVAGTTWGDLDGQTNSGSWPDAFITKFQPDGTQDWTRLLGNSDGDGAHALTTGSDGSIYVAGRTRGDLDGQTYSGEEDAFITKYQPNGAKAWTRLLGTRLWDVAHALTTGSDGSIYVAGRTFGGLDGQTHSGGFYFVPDAFISRFQPDGTTDWTRQLGTRGGDVAHALTTGSDGSIYVAGYTEGNLGGQTNSGSGRGDAFISRFQPDGTQDWTRLLGTSASDSASALTTGSDGSIYVAGWTGGDLDGQTNSGGEWDAFIGRFQPDGTQDWTRLLGTRLNDHARALTTGSDGSIYVAGSTAGDLDGQTNSGERDAFISRLIVDGTDTPGRPEIHQVINWDSFPPQITGVLPTENQGSITQPLPNQWFGTDHHDVIIGTASDETLLGFQGDDWLQVSQGDNTLFGGQGNDILVAGQGDDILLGNKDDDILFGGDGNDAIYGGQGNDTLVAGNGNHILFGDQGNDILFGGAQGVDTLVGGEGNDTLVMLPGEGYSIVTDFQVNQDMVVLLGSPDDYEIGSLPSGFHSGTAIYVAGSDQLVGVLEGVTNVSLEDGNIFGWG